MNAHLFPKQSVVIHTQYLVIRRRLLVLNTTSRHILFVNSASIMTKDEINYFYKKLFHMITNRIKKTRGLNLGADLQLTTTVQATVYRSNI